MSPEQATGEMTVDPRADLCALSVVTCEMLTGGPPFTGASVQAFVAMVRQAAITSLFMIRNLPEPCAPLAPSLRGLHSDRRNP